MRKILEKIIRNLKGVIIALKRKGEQEMVEMICPKCQGVKRTEIIQLSCTGMVNVTGIIQCDVCKHEFPFSIKGGKLGSYIQKLDLALPGAQSEQLISSVTSSIKEDVQEAERANYAQCFKACVTMCRRALQLALIDKHIKDKPLGQMILDAKGLFDEKTFAMAISIKGFGDIGAHRKEKIEPEDARIAIYMTVKMLNELFC